VSFWDAARLVTPEQAQQIVLEGNGERIKTAAILQQKKS
jgi:hypothetical protein